MLNLNEFIEYMIIGLISVFLYYAACEIIKRTTKLDLKDDVMIKLSINMQTNMVIVFAMSIVIYHVIKKNDVPNMYCRKLCYDDKCFMVCSK